MKAICVQQSRIFNTEQTMSKYQEIPIQAFIKIHEFGHWLL